ncbi:MAG: Lrp/AsnC family transcriptional regulator [Candidatus Woesearchaeota archaeon]
MKRKNKINKNLIILSALRRNARMSFLEISKSTGLNVSTLMNNVEKLNKELVKKYSCIVDFSKLGFKLNVIFLIKTVKEKKAQLLHFLEKENINNAYKISDDFEYYIEAVFQDVKSYDDFKRTLQDFSQELIEFFIVEYIIKEGFLEKGIPL